MDPWGRPHARRAQEPSGSSPGMGVDGNRPRGKDKAKQQANRSKVVETRKNMAKAIIRTRGGEESLHTT